MDGKSVEITPPHAYCSDQIHKSAYGGEIICPSASEFTHTNYSFYSVQNRSSSLACAPSDRDLETGRRTEGRALKEEMRGQF